MFSFLCYLLFGTLRTLQLNIARAHIDVLDSALSNAQSTVLRLEEEVRQKEVYVDRVKSMTKSLEQLQVASEKREGMEKKLRQKLGKTIIIVLERLDHVPLVHQRRSLSS